MLSFKYTPNKQLAEVFGNKKINPRFFKKEGNYIRVTGYGILAKGVMVHPELGSINIMPYIDHLNPGSNGTPITKLQYYEASIKTLLKAISILIDQRGYQIENDKN